MCHKLREVKEFLNTDLGKRVWVSNIPTYSPELNPDELIWAKLKSRTCKYGSQKHRGLENKST
jgi:hypothetical protein